MMNDEWRGNGAENDADGSDYDGDYYHNRDHDHDDG